MSCGSSERVLPSCCARNLHCLEFRSITSMSSGNFRESTYQSSGSTVQIQSSLQSYIHYWNANIAIDWPTQESRIRSLGSYMGGPHAKFSQIRTAGLTSSLGMRRIKASSVPLNLASSLGGLLGTMWRRTRFGMKVLLIWVRKPFVWGS